MMRRKLLLLALVLLLIPVGIVAAWSSTNYVMQRFVMVGGHSVDAASFSLTSVIGQPATDVANSSNYKIMGGFLHPVRQDSRFKTWLPVVLR